MEIDKCSLNHGTKNGQPHKSNNNTAAAITDQKKKITTNLLD